ncbi:MAG: patatin-like phospholipase family protein [Gammaproteobacteria bacterium]
MPAMRDLLSSLWPRTRGEVQRPAHKVGLVLPGGGARAAYQVGVLKAVSEMLPKEVGNPFSILSGTSAGAVNSAVLASNAPRFRAGVGELERVWRNFHVAQVYRSDALTMLGSSLRWLMAMVTGGLLISFPQSLLNNHPLRALLKKNVRFDRIQAAIESGCLEALAVTAAGYTSAHSITFFQGRAGLRNWERARREGRREEITLDHLMASVAAPFIFPPTLIRHQYFGDGAMRQTAPLSAAIHLGAERLLVVGTRNEVPVRPTADTPVVEPTFGHIAGFVLDTLFMDGLYVDLERLNRINLLVDHATGASPDKADAKLKRVECMVMTPSVDIREIAEKHSDSLPWPVRMLLKGVGVTKKGGGRLLSFLLFERAFTCELIRLGYGDAMKRKEHLVPFLAGESIDLLDAPPEVVLGLSGEEDGA